jgi:hypothetical protein
VSRPGRCTPRENTSFTHPVEGFVSSRTGLSALEAGKKISCLYWESTHSSSVVQGPSELTVKERLRGITLSAV